MLWNKIVAFVLYKIKLKARRRCAVLEKFLLRFRFGKVLFGNIYLIILALSVLGSIGAAIGVHSALLQIEFTANTSRAAWQVFFFVLLLFCCLSGLGVSARTLFPEDMQILARLPLTRRQLSFFVFAEHLSSTVFKALYALIIPLGFPLALATKPHLSPGIAVLAGVLLLLFGLLSGLLLSLPSRSLKYYLLKRGAFWKTLLFQSVFTVMIGLGAYGAILSLLEYFAEWLGRRPVPDVNIDIGSRMDAVVQWLNEGLARAGELGQLLVILFQHPFWPHSLAADALLQFDLLKWGLLAAKALAASLLVVLLANRFRGYLLIDFAGTPVPNRIDDFICRILVRLSSKPSSAELLFKKNLLLTFRQLEIVYSGGTASLFGGYVIGLMLGVVGGIIMFSAGTESGNNWNVNLVSWGLAALYGLLVVAVYAKLRFLLSVDGEKRNISLLKLANIPLADLYTCQVKLLRVITLPALAIILTAAIFLGIRVQFAPLLWLILVASMLYAVFIAAKVTLLGSVLSPRFEVAHFEESGQFLEQKVIHHLGAMIFIGAIPMFSIPGVLSLLGEISIGYLSITFALYGLAVLISHYVIKGALLELGKNIRQAEDVL